MKKIILAGICIAVVSCGKKTKTTSANKSVRDIKYETIDLDSVSVALDNSSYDGYSWVSDGNLYFFDKFFCYAYKISPDGKTEGRWLGSGRAGNEVPIKSPLAIAAKNDQILIMGGTNDGYLFNNWEGMKTIGIKLSESNTSPNDSRTYTLYVPEFILKMHKDKFYYNTYAEQEGFNPAEHSKTYFRDARPIMEVDMKSGIATPVGKYSKYYEDNHAKVKHLFGVYYDIDNKGNFHVSYQADSLIYVYDKEFNLLRSYGFQGAGMNVDYKTSLPNWDDYNLAYMEDVENKGYYYWIKNIEETGLLFRSYRKGSHSGHDGLQIYKDGALIGDVAIPKQFKVIGYAEPYYIGQIVGDMDNLTMHFYRFKLP